MPFVGYCGTWLFSKCTCFLPPGPPGGNNFRHSSSSIISRWSCCIWRAVSTLLLCGWRCMAWPWVDHVVVAIVFLSCFLTHAVHQGSWDFLRPTNLWAPPGPNALFFCTSDFCAYLRTCDFPFLEDMIKKSPSLWINLMCKILCPSSHSTVRVVISLSLWILLQII